MILLYNLGIRLYYILVLLVSPFNKKAKLWIRGRHGVLKNLGEKVDIEAEYVWFHVSSLGEFEQGRPIIEAIKKRYPELKVLLTFFSPSGYEIRKNYEQADIITYLPLDTKRNAKIFIDIVQPKWTFFVKYEYWYHFLKQTHQSNSKLYLVSGIFRKSQLFFKPYGKWYRNILQCFDYLFVQNDESKELLRNIHVKNVEVSGDTRFDRVKAIAKQSKEIEIARVFSQDATVMVCGSTWEPDESLLLKYIEQHKNGIKFIVAPHEIKQEKIEAFIQNTSVKTICYGKATIENVADAGILIIDNVGMLSSLYKYGQIAYIGGGFGAGIHNTLEAAVFGVPVIFGPNHEKFQEAVSLIANNGAHCVQNFDELKVLLDGYLSNPEKLRSDGKSAENYVLNSTGATRDIMKHLEKGL